MQGNEEVTYHDREARVKRFSYKFEVAGRPQFHPFTALVVKFSDSDIALVNCQV